MRAKYAAAAGLLLAGASLGLVRMAYAQSDENAGAQSLFIRYCAECHGPGGRGDGPAAAGLQPPPADLTRSTLSRSQLIQVIDGRRPLKGHGSGSMPARDETVALFREVEALQSQATKHTLVYPAPFDMHVYVDRAQRTIIHLARYYGASPDSDPGLHR